MKYAKVTLCSFALFFCMGMAANAQLLGGTLRNSTSAAGGVSGRNGGLTDGLGSTSQANGNVGNEVQGSANSATQSKAKADKKKTTSQASARHDRESNGTLGLNSAGSTNSNAGVSSVQLDSSSNTNANSQGKSGQVQAQASSNASAGAATQH